MSVNLISKGSVSKLVIGNQFTIGEDVAAIDVSIADAGNYYTSTNVEGALQEIGADLAAPTTAQAVNVSIADAGGYFTSAEVEGALQEVGADLANVQNLASGQGIEVAGGAVNIGGGNPLTEQREVNIGAGGRLLIQGGSLAASFLPEDELIELVIGSANLTISPNGANANRFTSDIQTLTISGGLIAWNMALGQRAKVTLTGNATLSNPTNATAAFPDLEVRQDATGGRVLSFGSNFVLPVGYAAPPTTANGYTLYHFHLRSDNKICVALISYAS